MTLLKHTLIKRNSKADELCEKYNLVRLEDCTGFHNRFKAMTKDGYYVNPNIKSLMEGKQPLKHNKSNPYTTNNIQIWIRSNSKNFELVSVEYSGSLNNLKWICKNDKCRGYNEEFLKSWKIIYKGFGCPECGKDSGKETRTNPKNSENLLNVYPDVCSKFWDYNRNSKTPDKYYPNSNEKVYWECENCGLSLLNKLAINNVVKHGVSCPVCSDGISYPEKFMFNFLSQLNVDFQYQKTFSWSKDVEHENEKLSGRKYYDFYIPSLKCIVETHGNLHYKQSNWKNRKIKTLKDIQLNDLLKEKIAKENKIENYITVDCEKSDSSYIKNSILNSNLGVMFDLKSVDWKKVHEKSCKNITKIICELWVSGTKSTVKICKLVKLSRSVVINHLKKGSMIGWCDYDPKEEMRKTSKLNGKNNGKRVIQLNKQGDFIKRYESISEASRLLSLQCSNILKVCNKERKSTGEFTFMYEEEYKSIANR